MGIKGSRPNLSQRTTRSHFKDLTCFSCQMQGWREHMEDYIVIEEQELYQIYAIFDGHGGNQVSEFLSQHFYEVFQKELDKNGSDYRLVLEQTFENLESILARRISSSYVGSTALVVLVTDSKVYIANLGDCRAILFSDNYCEALSIDHTIEFEHDRIINNGGYIKDGRINGSLTVARAFGDFFLKSTRNSIISAQVDIKVIDRPYAKSLFLASDGIWECTNNIGVRDILNKNPSIEYLFNQLIAKNIHQSHGYDNMSAILIEF